MYDLKQWWTIPNNLSVKDALDETQVRNMTNMSYDMTYFGKQEIQLKAADKPNRKYSKHLQ